MSDSSDEEDLAEVISMFKCRKCQFTSVSIAGIKQHAAQVHGKNRRKNLAETILISDSNKGSLGQDDYASRGEVQSNVMVQEVKLERSPVKESDLRFLNMEHGTSHSSNEIAGMHYAVSGVDNLDNQKVNQNTSQNLVIYQPENAKQECLTLETSSLEQFVNDGKEKTGPEYGQPQSEFNMGSGRDMIVDPHTDLFAVDESENNITNTTTSTHLEVGLANLDSHHGIASQSFLSEVSSSNQIYTTSEIVAQDGSVVENSSVVDIIGTPSGQRFVILPSQHASGEVAISGDFVTPDELPMEYQEAVLCNQRNGISMVAAASSGTQQSNDGIVTMAGQASLQSGNGGLDVTGISGMQSITPGIDIAGIGNIQMPDGVKTISFDGQSAQLQVLGPVEVRNSVINQSLLQSGQSFLHDPHNSADVKSGSQLGLPGWISQADLEAGNYQVSETKELFLCGQCNAGFTSMEQCKSHIEQKHHMDEYDSISDNVVSGNKCSIGIQARVGGRPGRKRKIPKPESGDNLDSDLEQTPGEKPEEEDENVEDNDEEYRIDISGRRSGNKRRIKMPQRLLDEYYVGKRKKSDGRSQQTNWDEIGLKPRRRRPKKDGEVQEPVSQENEIQEQESNETEKKPEEVEAPDECDNSERLKSSCPIDKENAPKTNKIDFENIDDEDKDQDYVPTKGEIEDHSEEENLEKLEDVEDDENDCVNATGKEIKGVLIKPKTEGVKKPRKEYTVKNRLVAKWEMADELKTPKYKFLIKCKYKSCRGRFLSDHTYELHMKCHRKRPGRMAIVCCECERNFNKWSECRYHLWREHKIDLDLYGCKECDFKTDMACKLDIHKVVHSDERPYVCEECGHGFKQPGQLRNHQVLHEQTQHQEMVLQPDAWFQKKACELCHKECANSKTLKAHYEKVHSARKVQTFHCMNCSYSTNIRATLQQHMRIHTGEKPFTCDICPFAAADHNSLRRHRMRHTGEKPYSCPHCSYSCIQSVALKSHLKHKHPDEEGGLFRCTKCEFCTVNSIMYTNHMAEHEKGHVPGRNIVKRKRGPGVVHKINSLTPKAAKTAMYACAKCLFSTPNMSVLVAHLPSCPAKRKPAEVANQQSILRQAVSAVFGGPTQNAHQDQQLLLKPVVLDTVSQPVLGETGNAAADMASARTLQYNQVTTNMILNPQSVMDGRNIITSIKGRGSKTSNILIQVDNSIDNTNQVTYTVENANQVTSSFQNSEEITQNVTENADNVTYAMENSEENASHVSYAIENSEENASHVSYAIENSVENTSNVSYAIENSEENPSNVSYAMENSEENPSNVSYAMENSEENASNVAYTMENSEECIVGVGDGSEVVYRYSIQTQDGQEHFVEASNEMMKAITNLPQGTFICMEDGRLEPLSLRNNDDAGQNMEAILAQEEAEGNSNSNIAEMSGNFEEFSNAEAGSSGDGVQAGGDVNMTEQGMEEGSDGQRVENIEETEEYNNGQIGVTAQEDKENNEETSVVT